MQPSIRTIHGDTVVDPYFELRDRERPETIAFLEAENLRVEQALAPLEVLEDALYSEMLGRVQETDSSVPAPFGAFEYYSRTEKGKQYQILCRRPRGTADADEQVILDCNQLAAGHEYFSLAFSRVSPDGRLLAFAIDTDGSEVYTLRYRDLSTGELLPGETPNVYYSAAWAADSRTFFYTTLDHIKRPHRLWRQAAGSAEPPVLVFEEPDERFNVSIERSRSGRFLLLGVDSHSTTEFRWCRADQPSAPFRIFAPRQQGVEYFVEHQGDSFWIRTNEAAVNFRLMRAPADGPERDSWVEVIAHRPDVSIEDMAGFAGHFVLMERENALKQIRVMGDDAHLVAFDEPVYTVFFDANYEYETQHLRYSYTSLVTPASVYDYDLRTRQRVLLKQQPVPGYDQSSYTSERLMTTDGVPVSLVYRKGLSRNGANPAYLYGYGSYGIVTEPSFSSERVSLLDRGFVFAMAHIRGSGDKGRQWYEDGKLMHKRNTFTDFIAAAELLVASGFTSPEQLAIAGGSAGGLLMGAVTNMRPDLFRAVVAHVPFVDVVNTMLDPTLPLTVAEYDEWGNPEEKPVYDYMKSYAPYENVARAAYPAILATGGLNDPRVPFWEPAKWVAKLREYSTSGRPILLKTQMGAGHGGPSGRYAKLKEKAFEYVFILWQLGLA